MYTIHAKALKDICVKTKARLNHLFENQLVELEFIDKAECDKWANRGLFVIIPDDVYEQALESQRAKALESMRAIKPTVDIPLEKSIPVIPPKSEDKFPEVPEETEKALESETKNAPVVNNHEAVDASEVLSKSRRRGRPKKSN